MFRAKRHSATQINTKRLGLNLRHLWISSEREHTLNASNMALMKRANLSERLDTTRATLDGLWSDETKNIRLRDFKRIKLPLSGICN